MLIDYRHVNVCQVDGKDVLTDVNLQVDEGSMVYIIGRVGSGKSSLLKTIYQELDIFDGETADVLGVNMLTVKRKHVPALRREMGVVFQDFQLLADRSVRKNLQFVLKATGWKKKNDINQRIDEVLEEVGMSDKSDRMPHELSGGEQQRIAIARSILNSPKLIIADEPTGNLDNETATGIMELLQNISRTGTAVVMSTHNVSVIEAFPGKTFRCHDGHFDEVTGNHNEIASADIENDQQK